MTENIPSLGATGTKRNHGNCSVCPDLDFDGFFSRKNNKKNKAGLLQRFALYLDNPIKLLSNAKENIGKDKIFDGIADCLIAFACRKAVERYGIQACLSLVPKTKLKEHYMKKYGMADGGWQLYLEGSAINNVLKEYFNETKKKGS